MRGRDIGTGEAMGGGGVRGAIDGYLELFDPLAGLKAAAYQE